MATGIVLGLVAYLIPLPFGRSLVAGNYIVIAMDAGGYAALMHLRHRSIVVNPGDRVVVGSTAGRSGTRAIRPSRTCTSN